MAASDVSGARSMQRAWLIAGTLVLLVTAALAWYRSGILDLPKVPSPLTVEQAGLEQLEVLGAIDAYVRAQSTTLPTDLAPRTREGAQLVRRGFESIHAGRAAEGLASMAEGVAKDPTNLVFGNAYRMAVFQLRRAAILESSRNGRLTPEFPSNLQGQPIALFERLSQTIGGREIDLQLALAWVDEMLLFPALEIKAPSSVESVRILSRILDSHAGYVPGLFARGMNHLHRPARLVWPESQNTPVDAAARDLGACVAIGREFGVGSDRLQALLAVALGDAYVKAGRLGVARSWWQIAQNLCRDADVSERVRRRYAWHDKEAIDRLEEDLDRSRSALDAPMTDLALMWS